MKTKRKCSKAQLAALAKGRAKLARMRSQKGGSSVDVEALTKDLEGLSLNDRVVETQPTAVGSEVKNKGRSTGTRVSPCCAVALAAVAAGYGSLDTKGPFAYPVDKYPVQTRPLDCGVMRGYVPMNTVATFLQNPYDDIKKIERSCGESVKHGATCAPDRKGVEFYKLKGRHPCATLRLRGNKLVMENPKENQKKTKRKSKKNQKKIKKKVK